MVTAEKKDWKIVAKALHLCLAKESIAISVSSSGNSRTYIERVGAEFRIRIPGKDYEKELVQAFRKIAKEIYGETRWFTYRFQEDYEKNKTAISALMY